MMKTLLLPLALLAAAVPAAAQRGDPEARLARLVEGRTAGEPVDCIDLDRTGSTRIIDDTAIVFEVAGTLYVNRPRAGAGSLDSWHIVLTRSFSSRLCNTDEVQLLDGSTRSWRGFVLLGDFVPYRRAR